VTIGDLIREGKLLEVHCGNCRPERHLYLNPEILRLPKRMPVPEAAVISCAANAVRGTAKPITRSGRGPMLGSEVWGTIEEIEGTKSDADHCGSKLSAVLVLRSTVGVGEALRWAVRFCKKLCLPPSFRRSSLALCVPLSNLLIGGSSLFRTATR
jgi:hypothetical protein